MFGLCPYSNDTAGTANGPRPRRGRLPTEPGPNSSDYGQTSPLLSSPIKSPPYSSAGTDSDDNSVKCKDLLLECHIINDSRN